jgi:hypothetical protein
MGAKPDELFVSLQSQTQRDRAAAILAELREVFVQYVTSVGPGSTEEKLVAVRETQPELHPAAAAITAQTYVVADAVMTALATHLARAESATEYERRDMGESS